MWWHLIEVCHRIPSQLLPTTRGIPTPIHRLRPQPLTSPCLYLLLPLAAPGLATAFLLSFARALGEYGATVTFAGNVQGKTQTIPLAIDLAINSSDLPSALGSALILISLYLGIFGVLGLARTLKKLRERLG